MKKIVSLAAAVTILFAAMAQQVTLQNSILWKISGNGLAENSFVYLAGKSCDANLQLDEKAKAAFAAARTVTVEYDLYGSKDAGKLAKGNIALADSQKIKNNLSALQVTAFENKMKDAGYPAQALPQLQVYKLNMVYYMLATLAGPCGTESQPLACEIDLRTFAKKANKEFTVLQTIDEVLAESGKMDNAYWKTNISYILDKEENARFQYKQEADLYKDRNIKELQKLYNNSPLFTQLYKTAVQKQHAELLAERMEAAIKTGSVFFAMQFSNVAYNGSSVFEILAARGYTITPY